MKDPTHMHFVKSIKIRSFFWSVFSRIRTEYGEMLRISGQFSRSDGHLSPQILHACSYESF